MEVALRDIAGQLGGELIGDPSAEVSRIGTLEAADADTISFLANPRYRGQLAETGAGVVVLRADDGAGVAGQKVDRGDLAAPPDRAGGQRVQQYLPQLASVDLGPSTVARVQLVDEHRAVLVEDPRRLATCMDDALELLEQPGRLQRPLPVVVMDVEHATLRPSGRRIL